MKYANTITAFFGILALLFLFCAGYFYYTITQVENEVSGIRQDLYKEETLDARIDATKKVLSDTAKARATLSKYLVKKDDIVGFIEYIEGMGRTDGAKVILSNVQERTELNGDISYPVLTLSINAHGSLTAVSTFLDHVEHMPYRVFLKQVSMNRTGVDVKKASEEWGLVMEVSVLKDRE